MKKSQLPREIDEFSFHCILQPTYGTYHAPERDAFRGMMSEGCRIVLSPTLDDSEPQLLFYKRVVMGDLPATRLKARFRLYKIVFYVEAFVHDTRINTIICKQPLCLGTPLTAPHRPHYCEMYHIHPPPLY